MLELILEKQFFDYSVTKVTIIREVKVRGWTIRGGKITSIDVENDSILNSRMLGKLKKKIENQNEFKNHLKPQIINTGWD